MPNIKEDLRAKIIDLYGQIYQHVGDSSLEDFDRRARHIHILEIKLKNTEQ